jgi:hypothetical protein
MGGLVQIWHAWNATGWTYGKVMMVVLLMAPIVALWIAHVLESDKKKSRQEG